MIRIGITGPTGAGKTTALSALEELGVTVIDADAVYHRLLRESIPLRTALTGQFGTGILNTDGSLDRKRLGTLVFADPQALDQLNVITQPIILAELDRLCTQAEAAGHPSAIDAVRLIESGAADSCDAVVAVLAPSHIRMHRIMAREGISEQYARSRVASQPEDAFFRAHCTHILCNDGSRMEFYQKALALFRQLNPGFSNAPVSTG